MPKRKTSTRKRLPVRPVASQPRFLWPLTIRLMLALFFCFCGLLFYLDYQIQQRFRAGIHPQPAHIYARPLTLVSQHGQTWEKILTTLEHLGYRKLDEVSGAGSYVVVGNRMDLFINPVHGVSNQPTRIRLEFSDGQLSRILNHADGQAVRGVSLEPELIGSLQLGPYQDRITLQLHQMPELLIKALLAMEDRNFESHIGVDLLAILRALSNNLFNEAIQGGSTITQQLVKNLFLSPERALSRKLMEALMALVMEIRYTKAEILQNYLNEIFLGQAGNRAIHGFALASEYYFARPVEQLKLHETALLVGMIPAPSFYNPRRHPGRALERRNLVLRTLASVGAITTLTADTLVAKPLLLAPHRNSSSSRFPAYIDYLHRQIRQYFSEDVLRSDGLKLFTSLDAEAQNVTQRALTRTLSELEMERGIDNGLLQGAAIVIEVETGEILALVGDRKAGYSGFNRAVDAQRPIGSLVKPLVYLTALERPADYSLASIIEDTPLTLTSVGGEPWSPQNYDKLFRGNTSLLEALTKSYNVPTVRLGLSVGVDNVIKTINRLGIKREIPDYPSLLLGANEHTPLEIAQLYQTIANHGMRIPLRSIRSINNRSGKTIARFPLSESRVVEPGPAYLIDFALKQVVRRGTAARLSITFSPTMKLAGKTGTTDNYRDSWFAGYSGNLLTIVWVGRDDNKSIGLTGSSGAMRGWQNIMSELSLEPAEFDPPDQVKFMDIDPVSGLLAGNGCDQKLSLPILSSAPITRYAACAGFMGKIQNWFGIEIGDQVGPQPMNKKVEDRR